MRDKNLKTSYISPPKFSHDMKKFIEKKFWSIFKKRLPLSISPVADDYSSNTSIFKKFTSTLNVVMLTDLVNKSATFNFVSIGSILISC